MPSTTLGPLLLHLLLLSSASAQPPVSTATCDPILQVGHTSQRIVGGRLASEETASYLAALYTEEDSFKCSAVVLSSRWLLSAAHCGTIVSARVGVLNANANQGTSIKVKARHTPPGGSRSLVQDKDILLLQLDDDAPNATFALINQKRDVPKPGAFAQAVGYGRIYSESTEYGELRRVDIPVVEHKECHDDWYLWITEDKVICAGYTAMDGCSTCFGDSGGPLLQFTKDKDPVVVGITSFGPPLCGQKGFPDVFSRVSSYIGWMRSVGAEFNCTTDIEQVEAPRAPRNTASTNPPSSSVCPVVLKPLPPFGLSPSSARIIGGVESSVFMSQYMVSLWSEDRRTPERTPELICSGVLLSRRWILTLCNLDDGEDGFVSVGGRLPSAGLRADVEEVFQRENSGDRDIKLIRLKNDPPDTGHFVLVNEDDNVPVAGAFARAVGYGVDKDVDENNYRYQLRQVEAPVMSMKECRDSVGFEGNDFFCTGSENERVCDACVGDTGGPILQFDSRGRPVVIGLILRHKGCGTKNQSPLPLYLRISPLVGWMRSTSAELTTASEVEQVCDNSKPCPSPSVLPLSSPSDTPTPTVTPSVSSGATPSPTASVTPAASSPSATDLQRLQQTKPL